MMRRVAEFSGRRELSGFTGCAGEAKLQRRPTRPRESDMPRRSLAALFVLLSSVATRGQPADPAKLTIDRIFESKDFRGDPDAPPRWHGTGAAYTSTEPSAKVKGGTEIVRYETATGKKDVLVTAEQLTPPGAKEPLSVDDYAFSTDLDTVLIYTNSQRVWRQNTRGDYWVLRRGAGKLTKLGGDAKPATLMFAKLSPDATKVGYARENNLYVESVADGKVTPLTADGGGDKINGTFDWVYEEELDCRDGWRWSPDGASVAYWQVDTSGVKRFTMIDHLSDTYPKLIEFAYPKTGERNSAVRVGVVSSAGGATRWLEVPGDPRNHYLARMEWAGNPNELVLQRFNRLQNALDVMLADAHTGKVRTVTTERDGAWVDLRDDAVHWVEGGAAFTWLSDRDGWRHLYLVSRDGNTVRRVTSGDYDVIKVEHVDDKGGWVYFLASPENATQQYLYRVSLAGKAAPERVTPTDQGGWHDYDVSPDGAWAVHTRSRFGTPPRTELIRLPDHAVVRVLAANEKLHAAVGALSRGPAEFFRVDAGDGVQLDGWMMRPPGFDPSKMYPVLFHVYGEPFGATVTDRWGGRNYLWHLMLTQQGYVVASIDNRGTPAPRGRDFRKAAFKQIGTLASRDQSAAVRELLRRPYLDPDRVGVWGWSGGGSMTLNLLFRHPELYRTGMAVAPVPDVRLYDTIYQERYLGLPQENPEVYKASSPITYADRLKGNLLIVHGTGDDNVHYQGAEKLADALIAADKAFTLMPYPNRTHAIREGKNTTRHLYRLLSRYLNENLPAGPKP
jgi:dipeptidyl-peptidase-4